MKSCSWNICSDHSLNNLDIPKCYGKQFISLQVLGEKVIFKIFIDLHILSNVLYLLLGPQFHQDCIHLRNIKNLNYKLQNDSTEWLYAICNWALITIPLSSSWISYCDSSLVFPPEKTIIKMSLVYHLSHRNENPQRNQLLLSNSNDWVRTIPHLESVVT